MLTRNKYIVLIVAAVIYLLPVATNAQHISNDGYNREFSFGVMAHPRGVGVDFRFGRYVSNGRIEYLEAEFLTIRHPKEVRIFNTAITNTNPYTYGGFAQGYARI